MKYSIKIQDSKGNPVGEKFDLEPSDVLKFIHKKGFTVIDMMTNEPLTEDIVNQNIGVSEGIIGC